VNARHIFNVSGCPNPKFADYRVPADLADHTLAVVDGDARAAVIDPGDEGHRPIAIDTRTLEVARKVDATVYAVQAHAVNGWPDHGTMDPETLIKLARTPSIATPASAAPA
jgi:hypothetical protein